MIRLTLSAILLTCFFSTPLAAQSKTIFGVLDAKVRIFRFVIRVDKDGSAELKSLDEGGREFKLDPFTLDDKKLNFELRASRAIYESEYDSKTKSYQGKWKQGGAELDLNLAVVEKVPADDPKEIWEGVLNVLGQKMALRFRVYDREKHQVLMDSPDQRVGGFSGTMEKGDGKITFKVGAVKGTFVGKLSDDKSKIKGTWSQGVPLPLELKKVTVKEMKKDAAPPKRPQTPKAPFPYESTNVSIKNDSADLTLAATLTIPKNDSSKYPCAILISGSGAQDRDETLMDHKPFWVIADHLGRNGIACLRFDDRGTAKSTGDHDKATSADFATDVSAIVDFLKTQPRIDAAKIGLVGHSEGGLIAPMVAAKRDDVAFIVMLAGPGVNGEKILKNQLRLILKAEGTPEKDIEVAAFLQNKMIELGKKHGKITDDDMSKIVDELVKEFPDQEKEKNEILANGKTGATRLSTPWMKYFLTYEPAPTLKKVKCPVLVLNGAKDTQVDPKLNLPAIKEAFAAAGKTNYKIVELADLNHLFQKSKTGGLEEYAKIEETFSPGALKQMSDWITSSTR